MREEAQRAFAATGNAEAARYRLAADMRFAGQYHELRVDLPENALSLAGARTIEAAFREGYAATYGRAPSGLGIEVLNWHLIAELPRPAFTLAAEPCHERDPRTALKGERPVYFPRPEAGYRPCPVYDRYRLEPGAAFPGPCIIEEREATIVVPPEWRVTVDGYRNVILERREGEGTR